LEGEEKPWRRRSNGAQAPVPEYDELKGRRQWKQKEEAGVWNHLNCGGGNGEVYLD
jgi:hypothetical protein